MRVLALDLSLASTGYAVGSHNQVPEFGTLSPPSSVSRGIERIDWIMRRCLELAGKIFGSASSSSVDLVVLEGYSFESMQSRAHALGELGGLVRWGLWRNHFPIAEVSPSSLKIYATGKGNAGKDLMLTEAVRKLGYPGSSNDEADAIWLHAMALEAYGLPRIGRPAANLAKVGAVPWPRLEGLTLAHPFIPPAPKKRKARKEAAR